MNEFSPEIPWDENAAPLYLAAIAEFSPEVAICFPPDQRERITLRARSRHRALQRNSGRWAGDPARFLSDHLDSDNAELDQLLEEHRAGLQKLALAQQRMRCLFETSIGISSLLPHAQVQRQVIRILQLKAIRELDRQDGAAAIGSLEVGLRLSRDLRPRGFVITQLVSVAMDSVCLRQIAAAIIRAPHCSRAMRSPDGGHAGTPSPVPGFMGHRTSVRMCDDAHCREPAPASDRRLRPDQSKTRCAPSAMQMPGLPPEIYWRRSSTRIPTLPTPQKKSMLSTHDWA